MRMRACVFLACTTRGESESEQVKTLPTVGCRKFYTVLDVNIQRWKSNSKSAWGRPCWKWSRTRNLTLPWEVSVTGRPRAVDYGTSPWFGHFQQALKSRESYRSHFTQSHVHTAKRLFAPLQAVQSSGALSPQAPVWQGFGRPLWPGWPLRLYRCERSHQTYAFLAKRTKCRAFRRLNLF